MPANEADHPGFLWKLHNNNTLLGTYMLPISAQPKALTNTTKKQTDIAGHQDTTEYKETLYTLNLYSIPTQHLQLRTYTVNPTDIYPLQQKIIKHKLMTNQNTHEVKMNVI